MLDLTAAAEVNGQRFDGVDLFLFDPHVSIDSTDKQLEELANKVRSRGLVVGSVVAPVWPPTGGGSAMGDDAAREQFPHAGPQRLPHRPHAEATRHPPVRRRADRLGLLADRVGAESAGQHAAHRRHVSPGLRHRRRIRRAARGRGRNLLGRHAQHAAHGRAAGGRQPPEDARLSGRHGPHAAFLDGLQRAGRSPAARRFQVGRYGRVRRGLHAR